MSPFLISNSFPFSLIRQPVLVEPRPLPDLVAAMQSSLWISAWGHSNTVGIASEITSADLRPAVERPALSLNHEGFPSFDSISFHECWLLGPDYAPGFRPRV